MRVLWCVLGVLLAGAGWADPQAVVLEGAALAPVRAVAAWLGAEAAFNGVTRTVTLRRDAVTLAAVLNTRAATLNEQPLMLAAPAVSLDGSSYLPARALCAAFDAKLAWQAQPPTLTLTRAGAEPLVLPAVLFPRPKTVNDDTLAGLTVGDHLALAVAKWGDWSAEEEDYHIPRAYRYTFPVDPTKALSLAVIARGTDIVAIEVALTGDAPVTRLPADLLARTGTAGGWRLGSTTGPATGYQKRLWADVSYSGDTGTVAIQRGQLAVVAFFINGDRGTLELNSLTLLSKSAPRAWVGAEE